MRQIPRGTKRFITGFITALIVTEMPLSASIAPLRPQLVPPIAHISNVPNEITSQAQFQIQTAQINSELDLRQLSYLEAQFGNQVIATEKYIPMNLREGEDSSNITRKILETSLDSWLNSPQVQNTNFGRSIASIDAGLDTSIVSTTNESLKLKLKPLTATTQIEYRGRVEAALAYKVSNGDVSLKLFKNIQGAEYSYESINNGTEFKNTLNIGWAF